MTLLPSRLSVCLTILWVGACGPGVDEGTYRTATLDETCELQLHCMQGLTCGAQQRCIELGEFPRQWGSPAWDGGTDVAVDAEGNIVVCGIAGGSLDRQPNLRQGDAFLTRFASDGTKLWTRQWGTKDVDAAWSVAIAKDQSIYAAGFVRGGLDINVRGVDTPADAFLVKFDPQGNEIWTRPWGSPDSDTRALAVAVTDAGVYVVGTTTGDFDGSPLGGTDAFVRKYSSDGERLWGDQFGSAEVDFAYAVAVDAQGNAYVAGPTYGRVSSDPSEGASDAFLAKYSSDGKRVWLHQWGTSGDDFAQAMVVDAKGAAYMAGVTGGDLAGSLRGDRDAFVIKVAPDGAPLWTHQWGSDQRDEAAAMVMDQAGDLWVTGQTRGAIDDAVPLGEFDLFVSRFDPSGERLGTTIQGTPVNDGASGIAVAPDGTLYAVGRTGGTFAAKSHGQYDIILTKP